MREKEILWHLSNSGFIFALQIFKIEEHELQKIERSKYARCVLNRFLLFF